MKLCRFGPLGAEEPGVALDDGTRVDVSACTNDYDEAFFDRGGVETLRAWMEANAASAPRVADTVRAGSPIARPSKIVCIGLNFRDHAAESGMDLPREPVIFFKATTSLSGPYDDVVIPLGGTKLDWEVELAVVMGRTAQHVPRDHALDFVAGYALHNDYSERSFQLERGGQWVKGKSADTFAPLGPFVVTRDELPETGNLGMWLTVNGSVRQRGTTANMIFDVAFLVSYVSSFMTLLPGDVISTGTPHGVALGMKPEPIYLEAGDVVALGIDGLGEQRQRVVDYRAKQ